MHEYDIKYNFVAPLNDTLSFQYTDTVFKGLLESYQTHNLLFNRVY